MTDQEIFNTVVRHLRAQGRPAIHPDGTCAYRGEGGTKCAVGCLIPNRSYRTSMEGSGVWDLAYRFPSVAWRLDISKRTGEGATPRERLLERLQRAHDRTAGGASGAWRNLFETALPDIAAEFGLDAAVLPEPPAP